MRQFSFSTIHNWIVTLNAGGLSVTQEDQPPHHLEWGDCRNVRDLGDYPTENGGRTRRQALVRSDSLHSLTPDGQRALWEHGVRTVIDMRLAHELERHPNPFAARQGQESTPRYVNLPIHDPMTDILIDAAGTTEGEYIVILEQSKELVA